MNCNVSRLQTQILRNRVSISPLRFELTWKWRKNTTDSPNLPAQMETLLMEGRSNVIRSRPRRTGAIFTFSSFPPSSHEATLGKFSTLFVSRGPHIGFGIGCVIPLPKMRDSKGAPRRPCSIDPDFLVSFFLGQKMHVREDNRRRGGRGF